MFNPFMKGRPRNPGPLIHFRLEQRRLALKTSFLLFPLVLPWTRPNSADHPPNPSWVLPPDNRKSPRRSTRSPNSLNAAKFFKSRSSPGKISLQSCAPLNRTSRLKRRPPLARLMLCRLKDPLQLLHLRPKLKSLPGQSSTKGHSLRSSAARTCYSD